MRRGAALGTVLGEDPQVLARLGPEGLARALDPRHHLGVAALLVERALARRDQGTAAAPRHTQAEQGNDDG